MSEYDVGMIYLDRYLPFLYALWSVERRGKKEQIPQDYILQIKHDIRTKYVDYLNENKKFYFDSELDKLEKTDIDFEYRAVLVRRFWYTKQENKELACQYIRFGMEKIEEYKS